MSHPTAIGSSTKRGFSFIELVVVIIILGVLVALLLPFFPRAARGAARRMHCSNNLKQLALAMHNYHDTYKSLPPAYTVDADGNRLHSWRTLLLPFLEQTALYEKIDLTKPWNDPINREAATGNVPGMFLCPADSDKTKTLYMVIVDPESCFPGAEPIAFDDITDGLADTLLIFEAPEGSGVDWMSPYDTDWSLLSSIGEKSKLVHTGAVHVALADGAVRSLPNKVDMKFKRSLLTIAAGDSLPYDEAD